MRIGLDARWIFPEITGIGSYTQELIRHLSATDSQNEYILFFQHEHVRERTAAYAHLDQAPNFSSQLIPYGPFSPRNQISLPAVIRKQRLDIYHSTNFMIPFLAFPRNRRGRTACAVTIHDLIPLMYPEHTPHALKTRYHPVYRWVMRQVGRRADLIITVSDSSRNDILRHMAIPDGEAHRVVAIHEGVADQYEPVELPARDEKTILYVGRMDPYKNVPGLLRVFARVIKDAHSPVRLKIIGPRDSRYPEVQQTIEREHLQAHIDWPGYVSGEAILKAYQEADLFVLPSLYEGFGLPVLEAMACGTPVVCSNRASLPEVAGDAAVLVDPENEEALKDAMLSVLAHPARAAALRIKGLNRAAHFSWERTAKETVRAYEQLHSAHTP